MIVEKRHYMQVNALSSSTSDYVIPNGYNFTLEEIGLDAAFELNSYVEIIWDPAGENQILARSYGTTVQKSNIQVEGNGSKILRIRLVNSNALGSRYLGGYFLGKG